MHSSRMRTVHSSSHLLGGVSMCMLGYIHTHTHLGLEPPLILGLDNPLGLSLDPPGLGLETPLPGQTPQPPPGYGPGDLPGQTPQPPPGMGLETPPSQTPQPPPLGMGLETTPCGQTDTCKNITFANFVCGR